jgi:hypothetical protein
MHAIERTEQRFDLWSRQYDRETRRPLGPNHIIQPAEVLVKDVAAQKDQRTERLILRRGAHLPVHGQRREKPRNLVLAYLQGMALAMEQDQPLDPADIRFLRPYAEVPHPNGLPHLTKQLGLMPYRSVRDADNTLE